MTSDDRTVPPVTFGTPFYFLRHGETVFNRERRFQGQLDAELSDLGRKQAAAAADVFARQSVKTIVSSPLRRAHDTALSVAERVGADVVTDPDLMECSLGIYEGQPYADWLADYWDGNYAPEGGEDFWQFRRRVVPALARHAASGENVLIVAHGGLWRALRSLYTIVPDMDRMPNALPLLLSPGEDMWGADILSDD
jgi:probable phosphoglycerate mutase